LALSGDIHARSSRGGGNVVIAAAISKGGGKDGKTASSFFQAFHGPSFFEFATKCHKGIRRSACKLLI
jgi:hypothetical protein